MKQSRHTINFQTSLDFFLYIVNLREDYGNTWRFFLRNVLYLFGRIEPRQHHHLLDKIDSLSHTALYVEKQVGRRWEKRKVICTLYCH